MLTVQTPAKINLTLEVLGKRQDGYHEIRSVVQTIDFYDEIRFEESRNDIYISDLPGWEGAQSLVSKTVDLLRHVTGINQGVRIKVSKRIPLVSGLGGDSSDAAATLKGLNELWSIGLTQSQLHELAAQLGSDVPFFLYGGTALMEGRGEKITPLAGLKESWFVLMLPDVPRQSHKTQTLYKGLKKTYYTEGTVTRRLIDVIRDGGELSPDYLLNTFENIAFDLSEELSVYRRHILKIGASNLHLAGSGPAMFTLVMDKMEGEELCARLRTQGLELRLVHSV